MYKCKVERHSVCKHSKIGAVSFLITFPRIVLAETVTHRSHSDVWGDWDAYFTERTTTPEVSKNSASSRAIPFERMLEGIKNDPFFPFWTVNRAGMQGDMVTDTEVIQKANDAWDDLRNYSISVAKYLHSLGIHKQQVNRVVEPFVWVTQLVTIDSVSINNFFALRCHNDADPHFRKIARMMYLAYRKSIPVPLDRGEWHLPFVDFHEQQDFKWFPPINLSGNLPDDFQIPYLIKLSAARCAWLSYNNHDKDGSPEAVERTYARLLGGVPVHASPLEHQLMPYARETYSHCDKYRSNVKGYLQARKLLKHEKTLEFNPTEEEIAAWGEE